MRLRRTSTQRRGRPFSFARNAGETGTRYYTLAFVQSYQSNQCKGAWAGQIMPNDPTYGGYFRKQIAAIRKRGPMIGQNDSAEEVFELADASTLLAWAQQHNLGRIAY